MAVGDLKDLKALAPAIVRPVLGPSALEEERLVEEQLAALSGPNAKESSSADSHQTNINRAADPVMMFNGQFVHEAEDLRINGAGIDFVFRRTYKNQVPFEGPIGFNWTHNYHIWLRVANDTIFRLTGDLREEPFTRHPRFDGDDDFNYWVPPDGQDTVLLPDRDPYSFALRAPDGLRFRFKPDPAQTFLHRLESLEDRHGNALTFLYDDSDGVLSKILVNHLKRAIVFEYDERGRICMMRDYTGRQVWYAYDSAGDLVAVRSPSTGRYKAGLTVSYEYSSPFQTGELQHNLSRIIDAAGRLYLENEYGISPGLPSFNRVIRQRQGSGEYLFEYDDFLEPLDFDYPDEQRPVHQTVLIQRNGQAQRHVYNKFGNLLVKEECTFQNGPRTLVEHHRYDRDGHVVASLSPEGVLSQHLCGREVFMRERGLTVHDEVPIDELTWQARQAFGQVRATVRRDGYAALGAFDLTEGIFGNFPDIVDGVFPSGMGDRANDIIVKYTYEPTFGQPKTISDPRFTNTPAPGTIFEDPRHEETLTKYDYESLGTDPPDVSNRFLVRITRPTPTLPNGDPGESVIETFTEPDKDDPTLEVPAYDNHGRLRRHVNPARTVTEYTYFVGDSDRSLTEGYLQREVVDPGSGHLAIATEYEVDNLGRVEAIHLPRSFDAVDDRFVTRTKYNELDQIIEVTGSKPFAFKTRSFYDRNGNLERQEREARDEAGNDVPGGPEVRTFCHDEEFNLVHETIGGTDLSAHLVASHTYDNTGKRTLTILPRGNRVRYKYDERMLPVAQTRGVGTDEAATTRTEYDGDGRIRRTVDARGNPTALSLDAFGRVVEEEDALGHIVRRNYDKLGNLTVERAFESRPSGYFLLARREMFHDELGRATRAAVNRFDDPLGPYQRSDLPTAFLDSPGPGVLLVTHTFHDAQGRVARTVDPLAREHHFEYDAIDRVTVETDPLANRVEMAYDAHGNLLRRNQIDVVHDPSNPRTIVGQRVFATGFTYDELDRMASSTDSLGNVTHLSYDSRGNQVRRVDPLGNIIRTDYDLFNRRLAEHHELTESGLGGDPLSEIATNRFEHDDNGNVVEITDARGRRTRYRYDSLDRRRAITFPDGSEYLFDYDQDGNLIRTMDGNGLQRRYTVDAIGRPTRVDVDKSSLFPSLTVEGASFEQYAYDGLDRRVQERNDFALCEARFNSLGWPLGETMTFTTPDASFNTSLTVGRQFDDAGSLIELTYPNGRLVRFGRDALNRLIGVHNLAKGAGYPGDPGTPDVHDVLTSIEYVGRQRSRCVAGDGTTTTYAHDGAARLIEIDHASPRAPLLRIQYLFDAVGNARIRHDLSATRSEAEKFAYDSLYRLTNESTEARRPFDPGLFAPTSTVPPDPIPNRQTAIDTVIGSLDLPPGRGTFTYDLVGNREKEQLADGTTLDYNVNQLDQYTSRGLTTFRYDANGNLSEDGRHQYLYDSLNRLVRAVDIATKHPTVRVFHDARGRRILELQAANATHFVWDADDLIAEYRGGAPFSLYVFDDGVDRPLQIAVEGSEHWYHTDLAGSVRLLTNRGNETADYRYAPFGSVITSSGGPYNPLLYTGRRFDERLGTYDHRSRQYDPQVGRFVQRDSNEMVDGTDLYEYAGNNPVTFVDPFGTSRWERRGAGLGISGRIQSRPRGGLVRGFAEGWRRGREAEVDLLLSLMRSSNPGRPFRHPLVPVPTHPLIEQVESLADNLARAWESEEGYSRKVWAVKTVLDQTLDPGLRAAVELSAAVTSESDFERGLHLYGATQAGAEVVAGAAGGIGGVSRAKVIPSLTRMARSGATIARGSPSALTAARIVQFDAESGLPLSLHRQGVARAYATFEDAFTAAGGGSKRHIMEVVVRYQGDEASWWELSGEGGLLGHTEPKALSRIDLRPGVEVELRGWFSSCNRRGGCFNTLDYAALQSGATIIYRSPRWNALFEGGVGHVPEFFAK